MKAQYVRIASDFHLEHVAPYHINKFLDMALTPMKYDKETVLLLAGDIGSAMRDDTWFGPLCYLSKRFKAVIYVEGNHFYYHNRVFGDLDSIKQGKRFPSNVYFLEDDYVVIDGILYIGCTLWTSMNNRNPSIMLNMDKHFSDYGYIYLPNGKVLTTQHTICKFENSKEFIFGLLKDYKGKSVVLTHHAPSQRSTNPRFIGSDLNPAFLNYLDKEIYDYGPTLWVHGHTHSSFDYQIGKKTNVVCNPCGVLSNINPYFNGEFIKAI